MTGRRLFVTYRECGHTCEVDPVDLAYRYIGEARTEEDYQHWGCDHRDCDGEYERTVAKVEELYPDGHREDRTRYSFPG